ncbi:MAG: SLC13 family permease [Acidobacteria bacterium]|nr:SLC13 family permease [Acidobacteriota bacterium]
MEIIVLFVIIASAVVLFFSERLDVEITAMLVMVALMLSRILTPEEALSGFSSPATAAVAGLLIMSAAIQRTGALQIIAKRILRFSRHNPVRIIVTMMISTGLVSMFVNNTPAVAVQLPIAVSLAEKARLSLSKILMPLSFAAILGGTCTMIGTSTNILVKTISAEHAGGWDIGIFEITPIGLVYFCVGLVYLIFVGRRITPDRRSREELSKRYQLREYITEIKIGERCQWIGRSLNEYANLPGGPPPGVEVIEMIRQGRKFLPSDHPVIQAGDSLLVHGAVDDLMKMKDEHEISIRHEFEVHDKDLHDSKIILAEGVLSPTSRLIGRTLKEIEFKSNYGVAALAIRRYGRPVTQKIGRIRLTFGDSLLLQGDREHIDRLLESPDFLLLERIKLPQPRRGKIAFALSIFGLTILILALGLLPLVTAVVLGSLAMVITGCISLKELYESFPFKVIILLGCLIPLGVAMEKTGAAALVARQLVEVPFQNNFHLYLLLLALVTIVLTEIMSNNATAVIMVPVAFSVAAQLGVSPKPLVLAVMFAASFSFLTPVGYQTNTIIYGPGGYRFSDFARVGAPLTFIMLLISLFLIPAIWPFDAL